MPDKEGHQTHFTVPELPWKKEKEKTTWLKEIIQKIRRLISALFL